MQVHSGWVPISVLPYICVVTNFFFFLSITVTVGWNASHRDDGLSQYTPPKFL